MSKDQQIIPPVAPVDDAEKIKQVELENEKLPPRAIKPLFKIKRLQHTKVRNFFIEYSF